MSLNDITTSIFLFIIKVSKLEQLKGHPADKHLKGHPEDKRL